MKLLTTRLVAVFYVVLAQGVLLLPAASHADTQRLIIDKGDSAYSNEIAREHREQWDSSRLTREKLNNLTSKHANKLDSAYDKREACQNSLNLNAYWEPDSMRCLDRRSGRPLHP